MLIAKAYRVYIESQLVNAVGVSEMPEDRHSILRGQQSSHRAQKRAADQAS
jgi:hypothetical protein